MSQAMKMTVLMAVSSVFAQGAAEDENLSETVKLSTVDADGNNTNDGAARIVIDDSELFGKFAEGDEFYVEFSRADTQEGSGDEATGDGTGEAGDVAESETDDTDTAGAPTVENSDTDSAEAESSDEVPEPEKAAEA